MLIIYLQQCLKTAKIVWTLTCSISILKEESNPRAGFHFRKDKHYLYIVIFQSAFSGCAFTRNAMLPAYLDHVSHVQSNVWNWGDL